MINSEKFIKRLEKVLNHYNESASSFAEKIGVQRSSISHLLSGRNKPSLDFILKILSTYPEVELYWLLNGKGQFPSRTNNDADLAIESPIVVAKEQPREKSDSKKQIERIIIFYKDGTFENYRDA